MMKLSCIDEKQTDCLSDEQIGFIVYDGIVVSDDICDYGIILGSDPDTCHIRAEKGAELYLNGKVKKLVCTGGVKWNLPDGNYYESEIIRNTLISFGIPKKDILIERQSKTTKENMVFALLKILREYDPEHEKSVMIITSHSHLKRSLALAERLLPHQFKICGACPENNNDSPDCWYSDPIIRERVLREIPIYIEFINTGWMDDIEF